MKPEWKVVESVPVHEESRRDYSVDELAKGEKKFSKMEDPEKKLLQQNIIAGLPGSEESFTLEQFRAALDKYEGIDEEKLRSHLVYFLQQIIPVSDDTGIKMALHSDDPPFAIFGLPRVVKTREDKQVDSSRAIHK